MPERKQEQGSSDLLLPRERAKAGTMKNLQRNEKLLYTATGLLVLSMLLILAVIPGIIYDSTPSANPQMAMVGMSLAMLIRLVILAGFIKVIREYKPGQSRRKGEYVGLAILLFIFALVYSDGAFAFLRHDEMLLVSGLMFASVGLELLAGLIMLILFVLKPTQPE